MFVLLSACFPVTERCCAIGACWYVPLMQVSCCCFCPSADCIMCTGGSIVAGFEEPQTGSLIDRVRSLYPGMCIINMHDDLS